MSVSGSETFHTNRKSLLPAYLRPTSGIPPQDPESRSAWLRADAVNGTAQDEQRGHRRGGGDGVVVLGIPEAGDPGQSVARARSSEASWASAIDAPALTGTRSRIDRPQDRDPSAQNRDGDTWLTLHHAPSAHIAILTSQIAIPPLDAGSRGCWVPRGQPGCERMLWTAPRPRPGGRLPCSYAAHPPSRGRAACRPPERGGGAPVPTAGGAADAGATRPAARR